jgi:hypothetical protein
MSWMEDITGARIWIWRHCSMRVCGLESRHSYRGTKLCRMWPAQSYSKGMCFVSVTLVVGLIVLVAVVCLLVLYFRKPANCKHIRSRVTSLFSVRHNGQFYYSKVSTHFQVRRDFISVRYWRLFRVLLILGLPPHCDSCHVVTVMLPNYSVSCASSFSTDQWWRTLMKVKTYMEKGPLTGHNPGLLLACSLDITPWEDICIYNGAE